MIHDGDLFYQEDLFQSVYELLCTDWCHNLKSQLNIIDGKGEIHDLTEMGPVKYAASTISGWKHTSSAHYLDSQLKKSGYKTAYSFAHKYNMTPLTRERILSDTAKLDWFYQVYSHPVLTKSEYDKMTTIFQDACHVAYYYAQFIWANNKDAKFDYPTILNRSLDWDKIINFLYGVAYEFHPKDVYKHITDWDPKGKKYREQLVFQNWCKDRYGIDTGCLVLCDEHMEKLRKILTKTDTPYIIQLCKKYLCLSK